MSDTTTCSRRARALMTALATVVLAGCGGGDKESATEATGTPVPPTTVVHPDDRSLLRPGGAISLAGRTFGYEELDKIQASTSVPAELPLLFNPTAAPSRRARNQLQYIVNKLGRPPAASKVDMLSVSASRNPDGGLSQLVMVRNGTSGLVREVHIKETIRTGGRRGPVLAQAAFKFAPSQGDPAIPAGATYVAELQFSPSEVKDRTIDLTGTSIDYEVDAEWR